MGILAISSLGGNIFKLKLNYYTFAAVLNDNQGKKEQLILTGDRTSSSKMFLGHPEDSVNYVLQPTPTQMLPPLLL